MPRDHEQPTRDEAPAPTPQDLLERGMAVPGIREAMEAYAEISRFQGILPRQPEPRIRHSTGANG